MSDWDDWERTAWRVYAKDGEADTAGMTSPVRCAHCRSVYELGLLDVAGAVLRPDRGRPAGRVETGRGLHADQPPGTRPA